MKKILILSVSLLMLFSLQFSALAYYDYSGGERASLFNDFADVVDQFKEDELLSRLEQVSTDNECEVAVVTVSTTGGEDITEFADDYYDTFGFGYGANDDGIMLVVAMDIREFAVTTHGKAIDIFTDYNLNMLEDTFTGFLSDNDYYNAFKAFAAGSEALFIDYNEYTNNTYIPDNYIENDYYANSSEKENANKFSELFSIKWIVSSLVIGVVIGFIYVSILKSQLKSVKRQPAASEYVVPGSFQLTQQRDIYMYGNIKKTPKPKANNSSGGKSGSSFGGGSSTHTSSSGRTHGGSRGSF